MNLIFKLSLLLLTTSFAITAFSQNNIYDPEHKYSIQELQEDFQFLRTNLEKTHPNLYLYTAKAKFNLFFDSLYKNIKNPLTETEFYNLITLLNSKIKDGHTMFLPSEAALSYFNENDKFFPFFIFISKGKLYVNMNCSVDTTIKDGAEIQIINNISASNIIPQLLIRQIRDGYNQTYPIWILINYFKEYFSFSFGHPKIYAIKYKLCNRDSQSVNINGLSKDSIKFYRQAKYSNRILLTNDKEGIILEINKQLDFATLCIKSFDNYILHSVYKQDFDSTIQKVFAEIQNSNVHNLVLDIRNNQGGDFEPSKLLLSYLLQKPAKYLSGSKEYENIIPKENNYEGKLFILINGGSFSVTGILSSYLDITKRGTFIGEETGGNKIILSGDPIDITLPNTKIQFQLSTIKYVIRNEKNIGHGVVPKYYIIPSMENVMMNKDTIKDFALNLIPKNNK